MTEQMFTSLIIFHITQIFAKKILQSYLVWHLNCYQKAIGVQLI